jgi:hypothetical protein
MEAKIDGFFQTVIRYLDKVESISNTCSKLQAQIEDHKSQYQMIESVNPSEFQIDSINERLKSLLLKKVADKISDFCQKQEESVLWFQEQSDLVNKKLEKCLESEQIKSQSLEYGEYITWMSECCTLIGKYALKAQYFNLQNPKKSEQIDDSQQETIVDESDYIFQHSKRSNQKPTQSFIVDHEDSETLNYYCTLYTMRNTKMSKESPKKKMSKK